MEKKEGEKSQFLGQSLATERGIELLGGRKKKCCSRALCLFSCDSWTRRFAKKKDLMHGNNFKLSVKFWNFFFRDLWDPGMPASRAFLKNEEWPREPRLAPSDRVNLTRSSENLGISGKIKHQALLGRRTKVTRTNCVYMHDPRYRSSSAMALLPNEPSLETISLSLPLSF